MIELLHTNAAAIAAEFVRARRRAGSPAMGMVMTLVVVVDEDRVTEAMASAREASHEHPARVLGLILGSPRGAPKIHAQVGTGGSDSAGFTGEAALIRLGGAVVAHPESVVLPLLLPDSPVVVWWAGTPPRDPGTDPVGRLAQRRITDVAALERGRSAALRHQCETYAAGSTDLSWTRLTPWRALLAAALDQHLAQRGEGVSRASVTAERVSPSADLLAAWLGSRLDVEVDRHHSRGPGLTEVTLATPSGPIRLSRPDGRLATLTSPGAPDRPVALKRRTVAECLAEELRRLDEDDIYAETVRAWAMMSS